jgi:hypothetical protein
MNVRVSAGHVLDPDLLRAVELLTRELESDPRITAVDGPALPAALWILSAKER